MSDATPVASSATEPADPEPSTPSLDSLSPSEMQHWRMTGDLPERKPADQPAASAPAKPAAQAEGTPSSNPPASEPGKGHKNADTRVQELLADRARERERAEKAERRLAEFEGRTPTRDTTTPADSSPARTTAPTATDDPEPKLADYEANPQKYGGDPYTAWLDARSRWAYRQEHQRTQAAEQQRAEERQSEEAETTRRTAFRDRIQEATKADPQFLDSLSDPVKALKPIRDARKEGEQLSPRNAVAEELLDSPVAPQLMRHWTDHPEDLEKLAGAKSPRELLIEFGRQTALVEGADARAGAPAKPPTKTVTSAPAPAHTLGARPAAPVDEAEAALERGDVEAYFRAQNAREMAAKK